MTSINYCLEGFIQNISDRKIEKFKDFYLLYLSEFFTPQTKAEETNKIATTVYYLGNNKFFADEPYYKILDSNNKSIVINRLKEYVSTLDFLEKQGYITLIPANISMVPIFDSPASIDGDVLYILKNHFYKKIIPNTLLENYLNNHCKTEIQIQEEIQEIRKKNEEIRNKNQEIRNKNHMKIAFVGGAIAIISVAINFFFDYESLKNDPPAIDSLNVRITNSSEISTLTTIDTLNVKVIENNVSSNK